MQPGTYKVRPIPLVDMFDALLGKQSLKERISELEDELERREAQLEAEQERRAEAARKRQTAEERINRLEDRIADLEGQLERAREGERVLEYRHTATLTRGRLEAVIDRLQSVRAPPEGALTAFVEGRPPDDIRSILGERTALVDRATPCLVVADDAGLIAATVDPPRPPDPFLTRSDRFDLERGWFHPEGQFAFALVRSDIFAYGEYDGPTREFYTGFTSDVQGAHSKGGYSQPRFERRRDEQIDSHLEKCRETLADRDPDSLLIVGQRTILNEFADMAELTAPVDATGSPESALDDAFEDFWRATVHGL